MTSVSWLLIAGTGAALLYGAGRLPPAVYDPLGPAGAPRMLGILIIALCLLQLAIRVFFGPQEAPRRAETPAPRAAWVRLTLSAIAVLVYSLTLDGGWIPFGTASVMFIAVMGFVMTDMSVRRLPLVLANAVIFGVVISYLFANILHVSMPG